MQTKTQFSQDLHEEIDRIWLYNNLIHTITEKYDNNRDGYSPYTANKIKQD